MKLEEILKEFQGTPLDLDKLSGYEKWALTFFHDESEISDPNIDLTLQLDITDGERIYRQRFCDTKGASFTAYLYWCLIQSIKKYPCFLWRSIGKKWYAFKNLPLTFPVIVGGKERFNDILLKDVCGMDWSRFCAVYRDAIDKAREKKEKWVPVGYDIWRLSIFIGNQPDFQFTSLSPHKEKARTGMFLIYFGKRYQVDDRLLVPFFIHFDHSNLDPYILGPFLKDYQRILSEGRA